MFMDINPVLFAKAFADDTRQNIMTHLCCVWLNVNDIVDKLGGKVKQPTVSHHLKILEEANLVFVRQEGRERFYTLNQEQITVCCGMLVKNFAPNYVQNVVEVESIPKPGEVLTMTASSGGSFQCDVVRSDWHNDKNMFVVACRYSNRSISAADYQALMDASDWQVRALI